MGLNLEAGERVAAGGADVAHGHAPGSWMQPQIGQSTFFGEASLVVMWMIQVAHPFPQFLECLVPPDMKGLDLGSHGESESPKDSRREPKRVEEGTVGAKPARCELDGQAARRERSRPFADSDLGADVHGTA